MDCRICGAPYCDIHSRGYDSDASLTDEEEEEEEEESQSEEEEDEDEDISSQIDISGKWTACFDQTGSTVTVLASQSWDTHRDPKRPRLNYSGKEFKVWSSLLCVWSEVFSAMINSSLKESCGLIEIADFSPEVVEACFRFMYSGKLIVKRDKLVESAAFADKYGISELKELTKHALKNAKGIGVSEMKLANFTAADFKAMGRTSVELKVADFTAAELKAVGFTLSELHAAGFRLEELIAVGFTATQLLRGPFSKAQLTDAGCIEMSPAMLRGKGFTASELRRKGFSSAELRAAEFSTRELHSAGFMARELVDCGIPLPELKTVGFTAVAFRAASLSASDLREAGFTAMQLKTVGYPTHDLVAAGFTITDLKAAKVTAEDLRISGCEAKAREMIEYRICELEKATAKGRPSTNSFVFASAVHSDPRVQAFFRSPEKTVELVVGRGINNARCCARRLSSGYDSFCGRTSAQHSTCYFSSRLAWDHQRTYSVNAAAGSGIGQAASIRMTKNGELHANAASRFDADMLELGRLRNLLVATPSRC